MILRIVDNILMLYEVAIIVRALASWFSPHPNNPLYRFLINITDPIMRPVREALFRIMPNMGIDFSPLVVILIIQFLRGLLRGGVGLF